jgi:nitroreductase
MVFDLVPRARTHRRFVENQPVETESLRSLVNLARLSPSSANLQTLKFVISADAERNQSIFETLAWAGYLPDWPGPAEGERPSAYIIVLGDEDLGGGKDVDAGLVMQSMVLGAAALGLATCILGSVDRPRLQAALGIPARYRIMYVMALGKPAETVAVEAVGPDGNIRYWRDDEGGFHVPKRSLDDLIVEL